MNLLICYIILFCNIIKVAHGGFLGGVWPGQKRNYVLDNATVTNENIIIGPQADENGWETITVDSTFKDEAPTKTADHGKRIRVPEKTYRGEDIIEQENKPISHEKFESRMDKLLHQIMRPVYFELTIDGRHLEEDMSDYRRYYVPAKPVTTSSVVRLDMRRDKIGEKLDLIEHCQNFHSYPLLTTDDIERCFEQKLIPIAVQLVSTPVLTDPNKDWNESVQTLILHRDNLKLLHTELKKIVTTNSMSVTEYASGIEAYIGYMDGYQGCTFDNGLTPNIDKCRSYLGGYIFCNNKAKVKHLGNVLLNQVRQLIQKVKNLGHRYWRWIEEDKKVVPTESKHLNDGELLLDVMTLRLKKLERHITPMAEA